MSSKHEHLNSLDSIRGIAALVVIFSHVFLAYYPEMHSGADSSIASDPALSVFDTPFTFFYRGQFAVLIFFILSGYVLTLACVRKALSNPDYIAIAASKRYLRLGIPVAASVLICYSAVKLGLVPVITDGPTPKLMDMPAQDLHLLSALASALYKSMLFGDQTFNYVLWTIKIEFYGSLLIFAAFALLGRNRLLHMSVCGALFLYLQAQSIYVNMYAYFFLGSLLARVDFSSLRERLHGFPVSGAMMIAGCYLGGYHEDSAAYSWLEPLSTSLQLLAPEANIQVVYTGFAAALVSLLTCLAAVIGTTYLLSVFFIRYVDTPSIKLSDAFGRALFANPPRGDDSSRTGGERVAFQPS